MGNVFRGIAYAVGFLIVSIHHAYFGIPEFSPFRPRIFSAGVLFFFLVALPSVAALRRQYFAEYSRLRFKSRWDQGRHLGVLFNAGISSALVLGVLCNFFFIDYWKGRFQLNLGWYLLAFVTLAGVVPAFVLSIPKRFTRIATVCIWLNFLLFNCFLLLFVSGSFQKMVYWFFSMGIAAVWVPRLLDGAKTDQRPDWEGLTIVVVAGLIFYSIWIYGGIKPWFGGGLSIPIKMEVAADSPFASLTKQEVYLLDESEQGFYLLKSASDRQAMFIPRSAVLGVTYQPSRLGNFL